MRELSMQMPWHSTSTLLLVWFVMGLGTGMEERTAAVLAGGTQEFSAEVVQPAMQPMPAWPLPREDDEGNDRTLRVRFFRPMPGQSVCRLKLIDIVVDVDGFWRAGAGPMSGEELFLSLYVDGSVVGTRMLGSELQEPAEEHLVEGPRIHLLWAGPILEGPNFERPAGFQVLLRKESLSTTMDSALSAGKPSGKTWSQEVRVKLVAEPALCMEHRYEALRLSREDSRWIAQPRGNTTGTPVPQNATIIFPQSNTVHALSSRTRLVYELQAPAGGDECALVLWVNRIPVWYHLEPTRLGSSSTSVNHGKKADFALSRLCVGARVVGALSDATPWGALDKFHAQEPRRSKLFPSTVGAVVCRGLLR
jgi:hypothetical protein